MERIRQLQLALNDAKLNIEKAQQRQSKYSDQHRREAKLSLTDRVMLSTKHLKMVGADKRTPKFDAHYIGPFKITRIVNDNAYELDLPPSMRIHPVINANRLKLYHDGSQSFPTRPNPNPRPPPKLTADNGDEVYEAEYLMAKRGSGRRAEYLVKWIGYDRYESTWEKAIQLQREVPRLIRQFERRLEEGTDMDDDDSDHDSDRDDGMDA